MYMEGSWVYFGLAAIIAFFSFGGFSMFRKRKMMSVQDVSRIEKIHDEIMEHKDFISALRHERKEIYKKYESGSSNN